MKPHALALLSLLFLVNCRASDLGGVEFTPASGWIQVPAQGPGDPPAPFPTLKFAPKDGRNAAVMISRLPAAASRVTDPASLKAFLLKGSGPMFPSPDYVPEIHDLAIRDGIAMYASFVDPSLVGKPPELGNYKVATPVEVLLQNGAFFHTTVFTDAADGNDFKEALAIVQSAAQAKETPKSASCDFSVAGLDEGVRFAADRFKPMPNGLESNPSYFSYGDDQGVVLTGWLDRSSEFKGMSSFWAREKDSMERKGGFKISSETPERIGKWDAILYEVDVGGGVSQKNIRACQVAGNTWADIHLSITAPGSTWEVLEATVRATTLAPVGRGI